MGSEISLRDWFAGRALTALLFESGIYDASVITRSAYALADAMLEARCEEPVREEDEAG